MRFLYDKELLKRYCKDIIHNVLFLLIISTLSIIAPLVLRNALDYETDVIFRKDMIGYYLVILTVLYIVKFIYNRYRFWFSEKFKNFETVNLYRKIFRVSYDKINEMEPTYITERVDDTISTIFNLYSSSLTGICVSTITVVVVLVVVAGINVPLAILYFLQIPLQYFGFQKLLNGEKSKLSQYSYELQIVSARNNKNIKAVISDVNSIKQYYNSDGILSFIKESISNITKVERKANSYAMDICTVLEYLALLLKNSCYIFIMYLYITNKASLGDMIYLNLINDIYYSSISDVLNIQINLRNLHGTTRFVSDEIENNYEDDGEQVFESIETLSGSVQNIGYKDAELIKDGTFEFHRGDIVALTGNSGTGKSTFVKTLNKFICSEGILVNGCDLKKVSNEFLREKIFYLAQESYLIPFSIKDNIALGKTYSEEAWEKLSSLGFMQKFVEQGLDRIVYENGTNLSGGDKQKIMLGRIFLQNPDVIILDESFNAIDEKSGEDIVDQIVSMYSDRIIIIISHSEKYLKNCNKRVLIKDKKLKQLSLC